MIEMGQKVNQNNVFKQLGLRDILYTFLKVLNNKFVQVTIVSSFMVWTIFSFLIPRAEDVQQNYIYTPEAYRLRNEATFTIKNNLANELNGFDVHQLHNRTNAQTLHELIPGAGGTPIINVVVTTFRSGSNFMEDVLQAFPGTFTHHETLWHFGTFRIRNQNKANKAVSDLSNMMHCEYKSLHTYIDTIRDQPYPLMRNNRVWPYFSNHSLYTANFLSQTCKMFPLQAMKLTRLLLRDAEEFLKDHTLNLKVIFLVRDPRGMMLSRWELAKHKNQEYDLNFDWNNPATICGDMETDFAAASELIKKYPDRFTVVRYEDFAKDIHRKAPELYNFLGLPYHELVSKFIEEHTQVKKGGIFSTFRDTNSTVFHWKNDITYEQLQIIQRGCYGAMNLWGYKVARSEEELRNDFYPIYDFDYSFSQY